MLDAGRSGALCAPALARREKDQVRQGGESREHGDQDFVADDVQHPILPFQVEGCCAFASLVTWAAIEPVSYKVKDVVAGQRADKVV
jgi:hypothetical protein